MSHILGLPEEETEHVRLRHDPKTLGLDTQFDKVVWRWRRAAQKTIEQFREEPHDSLAEFAVAVDGVMLTNLIQSRDQIALRLPFLPLRRA